MDTATGVTVIVCCSLYFVGLFGTAYYICQNWNVVFRNVETYDETPFFCCMLIVWPCVWLGTLIMAIVERVAKQRIFDRQEQDLLANEMQQSVDMAMLNQDLSNVSLLDLDLDLKKIFKGAKPISRGSRKVIFDGEGGFRVE